VTNTGGLGDITCKTYDELNQLSSTTVDYGPFNKTISYTYDASGNRKTMTDPDGGITTYEYDQVNRLLSITDPSSNVTTYEYDNAGRRTKLTNQNSVNTTYTYDAANRLLNLTNTKSNEDVISSYSYQYDNVGNKLNMTEVDGNITCYEYDAMDRLINVAYPDGSTTQYTYDGVGNRLTQVVDGVPTSYIYDADNRLLSAGTTNYSYDNNGNLVTKTNASNTTTYQYDYENRLTKVTLPDTTQVTYQYSLFWNRLSKTITNGTTYYLYDFEDILMELNETGAQKARYTHGPRIDEPISMIRKGNISYYHFDGLNSVTSLTDTNENVIVTYQYDAFGVIASETGVVENPYRFISREYEKEIGLYFHRARYYDPFVGRYITPDPIKELDEVNFYTYVENNPLAFHDPYGTGLKGAGSFVAEYGLKVGSVYLACLCAPSFSKYMQCVKECLDAEGITVGSALKDLAKGVVLGEIAGIG
ncbi:unnamed protein product, partial [marine sediment metagenome]